MTKSDCIFCKIANGEIPTRSIYEDENFNVILDMNPATKGHALILPKAHADSLYDLPDGVGTKLIPLAKKLVTDMTQVLKCDGFNLVQNNGEAAGQTVKHFHLHLIPRYVNDGQKILWTPTTPSAEELDAIFKTIKGE